MLRAERCITFLATALCISASAWPQEPETPEDDAPPSLWERFKARVDFSGTVEGRTAIQFDEWDAQKLELIVMPEFDIEVSDDIDATIIGRIRADSQDRLEPGDPRQTEVAGPSRRLIFGDRTEFELREAYLDTAIGDAYIRLGKQQIVWGKADGLKVLDVVNPQDFREFILDDFEDSRIPLWALNVDIPIGDVNAQFVWIPDTTAHRLPQENGIYEVTAGLPEAPPFFKTIIEEPDRPARFFKDSDVGVRLSTFWKGWDLTLNYLYRYDDFPALERRIDLLAFRPTVTVSPRYDRQHLVGATFSNAFGDLTLRGELAYTFDRAYSTERILDRDGLVESDQFEYVLGFDWFGISDTFLSLQVFQTYILDDQDLVDDSAETSTTFTAYRDFKNDTLRFQFQWIHNYDNDDGVVRPSLRYEYSNALILKAGVDLFYGTEDGTFGQFDDTDRMTFGVEWGF